MKIALILENSQAAKNGLSTESVGIGSSPSLRWLG